MPTVAYLGPQNTNTHFAACKKFGEKALYLHAPTVEDIFQMVERRKADFGVVPIENSLEGAVTHTLDRFMNLKPSPARICGEIDLPIQHHLISRRGMPQKEIRVVCSHPQALAQCRAWLQRHLPKAARQETTSTAEAVDSLLNGSEPKAAVGRRELALEHGLQAVPIPIARENRTRFLVLSLKPSQRGKKNKTSLMFVLKDKPGSLHDALIPFKENNINLTKIESRPTKRKAWEYVFFVDFVGHYSDSKISKALETLRRCTAEVRVLGSYPLGGARGRGEAPRC